MNENDKVPLEKISPDDPPPIDHGKRNPETSSGSLTAAFAALGFILFWVLAFLAGNASHGRFFVGYLIAAVIAGFAFIFVPRLKGLGIGILLGLLLVGGCFLLLLAICGGKGF
jgi:hypothetical protein